MAAREREFRGRAPVAAQKRAAWTQWTLAALGVTAAVAMLAAMLFAGLSQLSPGWRVAQAPGLAAGRAASERGPGKEGPPSGELRRRLVIPRGNEPAGGSAIF